MSKRRCKLNIGTFAYIWDLQEPFNMANCGSRIIVLACTHGHSALISAVAWTPKPAQAPLLASVSTGRSRGLALRSKFHTEAISGTLTVGPWTWVPHHSESSVMVSSKNALASQPWQQSRSIGHELREFPK